MKKLLLILILGVSVYGQERRPEWVYITGTDDRSAATAFNVLYLPRTVARKENKVEFWQKVVPLNRAAYARANRLPKTFGYFLAFITLDCKEKKTSLENFTAYSYTGKVLRAAMIDLYNKPIAPDSVNEQVWTYFCDK